MNRSWKMILKKQSQIPRQGSNKEQTYLTTEDTELIDNNLTEKVIGFAIKVHKVLGPGLLESSYQTCLYYELNKDGIFVEKEKHLPIFYEDIKIDGGYRIDLFVEKKLILEIKSVESLAPIHTAQVITYLKLSKCKIALLINFNVMKLVDGIKRIIL